MASDEQKSSNAVPQHKRMAMGLPANKAPAKDSGKSPKK